MNKREIHLDFTSLLDVIMIILFFFIIFGKIETDELKQDIDNQREEMAIQQSEAESEIAAQKAELQLKEDNMNDMLEDAASKESEAQVLLNEANEAETRSGNNADAIVAYSQSKNLKLSLKMESDGEKWSLNVIKKDEEIATIEKAPVQQMIEDLEQVFESNGYAEEDTILIELFYDETESGTTAAYGIIDSMLTQMRKKYVHCFCSETDKSLL